MFASIRPVGPAPTMTTSLDAALFTDCVSMAAIRPAGVRPGQSTLLTGRKTPGKVFRPRCPRDVHAARRRRYTRRSPGDRQYPRCALGREIETTRPGVPGAPGTGRVTGAEPPAIRASPGRQATARGAASPQV